MVKNRNSIAQIHFSPPQGYQLDTDFARYAEFRRSPHFAPLLANIGKPHRFDFYVLLFLTKGTARHRLDFQSIEQQAGELLIICPGQVHSLDPDGWDGWVLVFSEIFLLSAQYGGAQNPYSEIIAELPPLQAFSAADRARLNQFYAQLHTCFALDAAPAGKQTLLRLQIHGLITLLSLIAQQNCPSAKAPVQSRYHRFKQLLEQHFRTQRQVGFYAKQLACTEKSLTNACIQAAGAGAKALIDARILLEAKRLLAHGSDSVGQTGYTLGFDDPANFVKFFKKNTGQTPLKFRTAYRRRLDAH